MHAINTIENASPLPNTEVIEVSPQKESPITSLVRNVISVKQDHVDQASSSLWNRYNPILIGGDLFSMAYLVFEGVKPFIHTALPAMGIATLACGIVAGAINIFVAVVCLKEAVQAFYNGDNKLGLRLLLDFFGLLGIGAIMILVPLAVKIAALGSITAFFTAHPWVLPLIFFVITIPLIIEIGSRLINIYLKNDLAAELKLDELSNLLKKEDFDWNEISLFYGKDNPFHTTIEGAEDLIERMELLQADMGVTAAVEAFQLFECLLDHKKEDAIEHCEKLQEEIMVWNAKQHVRFFQQVLFVVAFIVSMVALRVHLSPTLFNSIENFFMAAANAIPLYMDTFWPFERNTTLVVPKVELEELENNAQK